MTAAPLLVIEDVEVVYESAILAVSGVSLAVQSGEVVALLGANGAGKSSLLRAISNILIAKRGRVTRGSITFDGKSLLGVPTSRLVQSGLVQVLEGRHCFLSLTVEENLIAGAIGAGSNRAGAREAAAHVYALFPALAEKRKQAAGLLSGGQQQMLAIGRALMSRPRLLLLDEPSMGLAPILVAEIFQTLDRLNREEGLTILLAEQNAAVALRHANRAVVLENGKVATSGSATELRARDDIRAAYLGLSIPRPSKPSTPINEFII
jgi:branched-chain amino acid transport system ATP-binding protein